MDVPTLTTSGRWDNLLRDRREALEAVLPAYMRARRWFGSKARLIDATRLTETIPIRYSRATAYLTLVHVTYAQGPGELYALPLVFASGAAADALQAREPRAVVARARAEGGEGLLYDALADRDFCAALLDLIAARGRLEGQAGALIAAQTSAFERARGPGGAALEPRVSGAEQSNTSVIYGDRLILKLFRKLEAGVNPDLEIGRFLTERSAFAHVPPVAGSLEYHPRQGEALSLAILQGFVPNRGDAWSYTLEQLERYFTQVADRGAPSPGAPPPLGNYEEAARLLGRRTAELHLALASDASDPAFAPEPFTPTYQRALAESMRGLVTRVFQTLQSNLDTLPETVRGDTRRILDQQEAILERLRAALDRQVEALRTRFHGDYHLGQVLYTGQDFLIIDFEGEPARPLSERRAKHSPLRDVAGMLRSFHYAPYAVLLGQAARPAVTPQEFATLEPWALRWHQHAGATFLREYLATAGQAPFLPRARAEFDALLTAFLIEKAVYELGYELNNRPGWVRIPVQGILQLLKSA